VKVGGEKKRAKENLFWLDYCICFNKIEKSLLGTLLNFSKIKLKKGLK